MSATMIAVVENTMAEITGSDDYSLIFYGIRNEMGEEYQGCEKYKVIRVRGAVNFPSDDR